MEQMIPGFEGTLIGPDDDSYNGHREIWNAMVDRRPALIARCTSAGDVAAAIRHARERGLEIGVKCGGHSVLGLSVPQDGLMVDLTPMQAVQVDPDTRRARVGGGSLLRFLDRGAQAHRLATTAGNVSHTGVGGLTLGGGMGWLARQAGLACDNVEAYTVVTADGDILRATATDHADLFWGLRGGGGNFGVVTEFEFRLHPVAGHALVVELAFDTADAAEPMRRWRDLLSEAPRQATLTADAVTLDGRSTALIGYVWVGDAEAGRAYLPTMRNIGTPRGESVTEMSYLELQSIGDENHHHGLRRYSAGHYLTELSDAAIDAFLTRGAGSDGVDWSRVAGGGLQAYGGAIGEVSNEDSAFSHRDAVVEFFGGQAWADPAEDDWRIGVGARIRGRRRTFRERRLRERAERAGRGRRAARLRRREARAAFRPQAPVRPGQRLPPEPEHRPCAVAGASRSDDRFDDEGLLILGDDANALAAVDSRLALRLPHRGVNSNGAGRPAVGDRASGGPDDLFGRALLRSAARTPPGPRCLDDLEEAKEDHDGDVPGAGNHEDRESDADEEKHGPILLLDQATVGRLSVSARS